VDLFDTHCHLNHESFDQDLELILDKAKASEIKKIIVPGWDIASSKKAIALSESHPGIFAAVGFHPTEWQKVKPGDIAEIEQLAHHSSVVAIGEIGLDFYHDAEHKNEQRELLLKMFAIADNVNKPVILHSRESIEDLIFNLKRWTTRTCPGVMHAFEGNIQQAKELIELGFMLGVGGPLTYKNSSVKKEVFSEISVNAILLETDSPYLPPVPHRGERNEPSLLPLVGNELAKLRATDKEQLCEQIFKNSYKMFLQDIIH
jgi:TatD DNase family protein